MRPNKICIKFSWIYSKQIILLQSTMLGMSFFRFVMFLMIMVFFKEGTSLARDYHLPLNGSSFVQTSETRFVVNGKPLYFNGFNAYWVMYMASDPSTRVKVSDTFQQASQNGLNVVRTWAFSDGGNNKPLQYSPGSYNEKMFKGLDFVVSEAKKYGIRLVLSLVNNWDEFGGKKQYNQWARDAGQYVNNDDEFYSNPLVKQYYKNHIKAILTRLNSISGLSYKDDSTIFAWELMNEPRCQSDLWNDSPGILNAYSIIYDGNMACMFYKPCIVLRHTQHLIYVQAWIVEMAAHVKSINKNHLLEVGLEGFYGESMPERKQYNPGYEVGTDFISNTQLSGIDFSTLHLYPDQWTGSQSDEVQAEFVERWIGSHIEDSKSVIKKTFMITEFGKSSRSSGYSVVMRDNYFKSIFNKVYQCARNGGPCSGTVFWQVMAEGMEGWSDGYDVCVGTKPFNSQCHCTTITQDSIAYLLKNA